MKKQLLQVLTTTSMVFAISMITGCAGKTPKRTTSSAIESQMLRISFEDADADAEANRDKSRVLELDNINNSSQIIRLTNEGGRSLSISNIQAKSTTPKLFSMIQKDCDSSIAPDDYCEIKVSFLGKKGGEYEQLITFDSNDVDNPTSYIKVKVDAEDTYLGKVSQSNKSNEILPMLEFDFNRLDATRYIDIENTGRDGLEFGGLEVSGADAKNFSVLHSCPAKLGEGEKCKITAVYDPKRKKGQSHAMIKILTNGKISPSNKIALIGNNDPYTLKVRSFVVSKNIKEYLDDLFTPNNTYYLRTIYQSQIDPGLESMITSKIHMTLRQNRFIKVSTPSKAKKIISLYPNITFDERSGSGKMTIKVGMHGLYATKSSYNRSNLSDKGKVVLAQKTDNVNFTSIDTIKKFYDKEPFSFFIEIDVTGYEDKDDVNERLSEIIAEKFAKVLDI